MGSSHIGIRVEVDFGVKIVEIAEKSKKTNNFFPYMFFAKACGHHKVGPLTTLWPIKSPESGFSNEA